MIRLPPNPSGRVDICARCKQPIVGDAAFNPHGLGVSPSYMHPDCAALEKSDIEKADLALRDAAPELLRIVAELAGTDWEKITLRQLQSKARALLARHGIPIRREERP